VNCKTIETDINNNNILNLNYPGSFLSRVSNEPGLEQITTVLMSNKTFDSSILPRESAKI